MDERSALSELCRLLPDLRDRWSGPRLDLLEEGIEGLSAGTVSAVEVCARVGIPLPPVTRGTAPPAPGVYSPLPGLESPRIPAGTYACPRRQCGRREGRDADGRVPDCTLFGEPLRLRTRGG
ncbi:hypothetical protein IPZ58_33280 [Streptomyces roseoverticillatus]|uniref:hypothetical protein n=1 Tax=Streptomyces roseoverticillatus TaxID=66429 RepID=UPI001F2EC106|nr:hypothetical protein [Streptomyces roseoverticillatus]MCF3106404.1 hypothetical protein [Streptomyces roseoverticillatus]